MLKSNQLSSVDNFWLLCYVDVCHGGICYKDQPGENLEMEIPNWSTRLSCPSLKTPDAFEELVWKRSFNNFLDQNYQNPFLEKEFKVKKIIKEIHPHQKVIAKYFVK